MRHTGPLDNDPEATVVRPRAAVPVHDHHRDHHRDRDSATDPDATARRPIHTAADTALRALDPDATVTTQPAGSLPRVLLPESRRLPLALAPGFRLHEYRIERVLGQGGFGIT